MKTQAPHTVRRLMRAFATLCLFATLAPAASQAEEAAGTPATRAQLVATPVWQLTRLGAKPAIGTTSVTLTFGENGNVSGRGGVNRFSGSYTLTAEGAISIIELVRTEMASIDPDVNRQETEFFHQLSQAKQAQMSENQLILDCREGDGKTVKLVFEPAPAE